MSVRLVPSRPLPPLDREGAQAEFQQHWEAARADYASVLEVIGGRWAATLIERRYKLTPGEVDEAAAWARDLARRATQLADEIERASRIVDRVARSTS